MLDRSRPLRLEDIPVMNFGSYIIDNIKHFGDQKALVDGTTGKTYTYRHVTSRSERLAAGLQRFGVQPGDVIALVAPNHIDYLSTYYATALINAVLQAVNPLFTKDGLNKVFKDGNTKFVITTPDLLRKITQATAGLPDIKVIVLGYADGFPSLDSLLAPEGTQCKTYDADWKTTTAVLLYSSGTTGFPKAVQISHFSLIANVIQLNYSDLYHQGDSVVSFLPMFHIYGICVVGSALQCIGCKLVVMARFELEQYLSLIQTYKPSLLFTVPPIMVQFAKHPKVLDYNLSSVKRIFCGAAPLSAEIEAAVKKRIKHVDIHQGYGLTEAGNTNVNTYEAHRYNSAGKPMALIEMKIVDTETGQALGTNETGEVWLRGPQVFSGYLNLPEQTKQMFAEGGWVKTGDIGRKDEDGFLYIVDRMKELIKYKGFQVAPATLEDILLRHEGVADVGVIGVPDEEAGELPRAFVVKKHNKHTSEEELQNFVAGLVAPYMKLRGGIEFVHEIPRSPSGKILRRILRERSAKTRSKL